MFCSFNTGDNQKVYKAFTTALTAIMNDIANNPTGKFDIKEVMKMIYDRTMARTSDHEQSVNNARMVPNIIMKIATRDKASAVPLLSKGLDIGALFNLSLAVESEKDGMAATEKELGITKDLLGEAKELSEEKPTKKRTRKKKVVNESPEGQPARDQLELFDEEGNPIIGEVEDPEVKNDDGEIIFPATKRFEAIAPHARKDTDQEAISMDNKHSMFNVIDPAKKFFYKVKRKIVSMLRGGYTGSEIDYPGVGKLYLRAQSSSLLPSDTKLASTTPVVMIVVDAQGNPVKFDDEGNVNKDGKISFYNLRTPYDINGDIEQKRIIAIAETHKITRELAKELIEEERKSVEDILDYISKDTANSVVLEITGGQLGHLGSQEEPYLIGKVNFGTDPFVVEIDKGKYTFTLPSISNDTIQIAQAQTNERPELVKFFADFATEEIFQGVIKLDNTKKKGILEKYLMLSSDTFTLTKDGPKVKGQLLDVSTPEARAEAKRIITEHLTNLSTFGKVLTKEEVNSRVSNRRNPASIVTSIEGAKRGDILVTKDDNTGEDVYRVLGYTTLNITQKGMNDNIHFSLEENPDGGMNATVIPNGYLENYVKNNFMIDKLLNAENQLVALNAYMTFSVLGYETGKLDKYTPQEADEELDDYDAFLKELSEKEKEEYDKLPAEAKEADAIINQARQNLPYNGVMSQQIVLTFENNLKANLYSRELAEKILEALPGRMEAQMLATKNFSASQLDIAKRNIQRYTKPVAAPVSTDAKADVEAKKAEIDKAQKQLDGVESRLNPNAKHPLFNVGQKHNVGNNYLVVSSRDERNNTKEEGVEVITKIISPAKVDADGKMTKSADVEVGIFDSYEQAQEFVNAQYNKYKTIAEEKLAKANAELAASVEEETTEIQDPLDETNEPDSSEEKKRKLNARKANRLSGRKKRDGNLGQRPDDSSDSESYDDETYFKRVIQQSGGKVTQEQIDAARAWYVAHPLNKYFSFREMFSLVNEKNPDAVAEWSMNGIVLYKGSDLTDLYHEAFHGFTQAFMSPAQRKELYDEVRKMAGTFVDFEGKATAFKYANDKQVEEYLAEDFRKYMLSNGKSIIKSAPKRNSFFRKLLNILEAIFGNLTIQEVTADFKANSKINEIYEKLRVGDLSDYNFNKTNVRFNSLDKNGIQAVQEDANLLNLNNTDTKLIMDSIDGWIAQSIDSANAGIENPAQYEKFIKKQIDLFMNRVSPEKMEKEKLKMASRLTYTHSASFLKTKQGREIAYRRIYDILSNLELELDDEYHSIREKDPSSTKLQDLANKLSLIAFTRNNFGDLTNIANNKPDKDGKLRGVMAYHMAKSDDFGIKASELLETEEQESITRDGSIGSKDGAAISQKDLAKPDVKFLFKTLFKMDPKTRMPILNEMGAPVLMDSETVWGKVAVILENERDIIKMYEKLLAFAQQEDPTELTMAVGQLINKLGPRGLAGKFRHIANRQVENLWSSFYQVFNMRRVGLISQNIRIEDGNTISTIGRAINPYAKVGKGWNTSFQFEKNDYTVFDTENGITYLDVKRLLKDYPSSDSFKAKGKWDVDKVFKFLNAIGIKMTDNAETRDALENGNVELANRPEFHVISTLYAPRKSDLLKDTLNTDKSGGLLDPNNTKGYSLLEIILKNGIIITKPEDIFSEVKGQLIGGQTKEGGELRNVYISGLAGEKQNWNELQTVEGQLGSGVPSFMVTTADGNTKFEMSLNSTMSIMVSSFNEVQDDEESSAYQKLIDMRHMSHFDIDKNPNAKRYVWLRNMFNLDVPRGDEKWGTRKTATGGRQVKLELFDISGAKSSDLDGVSSASADPFTKFILDLHLATQAGLPELMRHSDKSTSYAVALNYITSPDILNETTKGMYIANHHFGDSRNDFHATAFQNYILPNIISEHNRVQRFKVKKQQIEDTLKQIAKEKKEGKQITPTPVFDFNYLAEGQKFLSFEGILNEKTKKELFNLTEDLETYLNDKTNPKAQALINTLLKETENYFKNQFLDVKALYNQNGAFVGDNHANKFRKDYNDYDKSSVGTTMSDNDVVNALLNSWVYNGWIHNIESMNALYGDIALYNHAKEEFHKRNAGIGSTGTGYRVDKDMLFYVNNTLKRGFEQQFTDKPMREYDGTFNVGVMKEKITRSVYLEEIAFGLYNQMKAKAVRANNSLPTAKRRSENEIENEIKIKLFGNKDIDASSLEALKGMEPSGKSIMAKYNKMEEADGQGWIGFDSYRILAESQGNWSPAQENMYQAMLAGKEIPGDKVGTFFPPIKAQYWGTLDTSKQGNPLTDDVSIMAFHKFQLTPIVPSLTKISPKLNKLNEKMMAEGMDYVTFRSGSKVGTLTSVQFDSEGKPLRVDANGKVVKSTDKGYSDKLNIASISDDVYNSDRDITDVPFTKNIINIEYLKNQLNIEPKWKGKVTFATQIRKLIEVDLFENGIPTDYKVGESIENRIDSWFSLSENEKLDNSKNYRQALEYEKAVYKLTIIKKAQLIKKAKLRFDKDGKLISNVENLINYVKSQLTTQELAEHEIDFLDVDKEGKLLNDLSYSFASEKIERLLNALVVKSLIKQTVNGEPLIQVASAMLEPQFKLPTKEILQKYGTNGLTYYSIDPTGKFIKPMKIKISMQGDFEKLLYLDDVAVFKDTMENGKVVTRNGKPVQELDYNASLNNLNMLIKDDAWLDKGDNRKMITTHGDRIPIQGMNSDEFAEVYEFLPKEEGNIIILPAEIVAKSGGDFDIDKLTMMFPNIGMSTKTVDGVTTHTVGLYTPLTEADYFTRYEQYKKAYAEKSLTSQYQSKRDKVRALELHYTLFGGQEQVLSSVIEMALEEGELLTLEEFILADQEKTAQNDVLFAMNTLSSNVLNYSNLVRPNGTDILDPIVDELKGLYREYNPQISTNDEKAPGKGIQASRIYEIGYNLYKQMTNNYGKKALGIGAIDNTYNELFNRVGMYLVPNNRELLKGMESDDIKKLLDNAKEFYKQDKIKEAKGDARTKEEKQAWTAARKEFTSEDQKLVEDFERQTLYLPHNQLKVKDLQGEAYKDKAISFSHLMDVNGEHKIGDVINQLMNGWVDIAKDPWIFYLRGDEKLGPILLFLIQAGVPVRHAALMVSQPVIVEYMQTIDKLQSTYASIVNDTATTTEEKITRDKAVLAAKEIMLEKLGIKVEGKTSADRVRNLKKVIARESVLATPENEEFTEDDLRSQLDYTYDKYPMAEFLANGEYKRRSEVDFSDPELADYQKSVLLHFLQITDMESALKDVKLRTNVDTAKSGSLYEAQNKIIQLQEIKRSRTDDVKNSQTQYWRLPSQVIERMIPTLKDSEGNDTGLLDETAANASVLASFYQQPFQLEIWKDLFPLNNNPVINKYMIDKDFASKDEAKSSTYLKTDVDLMSGFKSSLVPAIFQNSYLGMDVKALLEANDRPMYYRGEEVRLNKVVALPMMGAIMQDGIMYFDYDTLYRQFNNKEFVDKGGVYSDAGLSPVQSTETFTTFGEYVKFVFEREYIRAQYIGTGSKKDLNRLQEDPEFKSLLLATVNTVDRSEFINEGETKLDSKGRAEWKKYRLKAAFEMYIRNKALQNVDNMYAMFNNETAYAYEIARIKKYEGLTQAFSVLANLVPDSENAKSSDKTRVNLAYVNTPSDKQTRDSYYEQVQVLSNEVLLAKAMPSLTRDELNDIATVFRKLPIVAFLQSGMNGSGKFAITRIVDQNVVLTMTKQAGDEFINKISSEAASNVYSTLNNYWNAFVAANKRYDARGKNYMIKTDKEGNATTDLSNALFVQTDKSSLGFSRPYDPQFINDEGVPVLAYARIGDKVNLTTNFNKKAIKLDGVIQKMYFENGRVVVEVEVTKKDGQKGTHIFQYKIDGSLAQWQTPTGNIASVDLVTTSINISKDTLRYLNSISEGEPGTYDIKATQVGDKVAYTMSFDAGQRVVTAEVVEMEPLGFDTIQNAGRLEYSSNMPKYRLKLEWTNADNVVKNANVIIFSDGKIDASYIEKLNKYLPNKSSNNVIGDFRSDRIKAPYIANSLQDASQMAINGIIRPGSVVDVKVPGEGNYIKSELYVYDEADLTFKPLQEQYTGEQEEEESFNVDEKNFFLVYNEAEDGGISVAATRLSATPLPKSTGNVDVRDRFIHHAGYQNKIGILTRLKYGGGSMQEFIKDGVDAETGAPIVDPYIKYQIDSSIEAVIKKRDDSGLKPVFSKAGYGQYMIGANDETGKMFFDEQGKKIGIAQAPETFRYLSTRLLEEFGYINPNFVTESEGVKEVIRVVKQPVSDQEYMDMMNRCFNIA
jgi:hypothetical protein